MEKQLESNHYNPFFLPYKFLWNNCSDDILKNQIVIWEEYDRKNQIHLNNKYKEFLKDKTKYKTNLLSPLDHYEIDFEKLIETNLLFIKRIRSVKINFIEEKKDEDLKKFLLNTNNFNKTEQFEPNKQFFWKSNKYELNSQKETIWTPYDLEDQIVLTIAYENYLIDQTICTIDLLYHPDYYIDFRQMVEICKIDTSKQKLVQYANPKSVTNIFRKTRYDLEQPSHFNFENTKPKLIQNLHIVNHNEFIENLNDIVDNNFKKKIKIYFNVFPENPIKLKIDSGLLSFLTDKFILDNPLEELIEILCKEISIIGTYLKKEFSINKYTEQLKLVKDCKSFFEIIIKIYSFEGFLYKELNFYLKYMDIIGLEKLKYYYICLLAAFNYFNQYSLNSDKDLILYRVSEYSKEELKEYDDYKKNSKTKPIRVFNEFLSCSKDPKICDNFYNDDYFRQFIWKIIIPKDIIQYQPYNFIDISNISQYNEQEVLIRSRAVFQIDELIPCRNKLNKYQKNCTLKSFSLSSILKTFSINHHIGYISIDKMKTKCSINHIIYLSENLKILNNIKSLCFRRKNLGEDIKNMKYLSAALKVNNSIENLNLEENNLGVNVINMIYLSEALKINSSIIHRLFLEKNNLGANIKNMMHLSEALKVNNSIKEIWLRNNNLGEKEENLMYISDAIKINNSIKLLDLYESNLGANEKNMKYISEALEINNSIQTLWICYNNIGTICSNMQYLSKALKVNNSIKILDLQGNNLGANEKNMMYLLEALEINSSIQDLNLWRNNLGNNEDDMIYFSKVLKVNKHIKNLYLSYNMIGKNENDMKYLCDGLKLNKSIQMLYLGEILGNHGTNIKLLIEALNLNRSIKALHIKTINSDEKKKLNRQFPHINFNIG